MNSAHRVLYRGELQLIRAVECARCGKVTVTTTRSHKRYCSHSCRELAYQARRRARLDASYTAWLGAGVYVMDKWDGTVWPNGQ